MSAADAAVPTRTTRLASGIPLVVGSLGAAALRDRAHGRPLQRDPLLAKLDRLAEQGVAAVEDYVGWNVCEAREGDFDPALHLEHLAAVQGAGLRYLMYPWLHALPAWALEPGRCEPFVCLEHGRSTCGLSIFAASTFEWFDRFFERLAGSLGNAVDQLTLAVPCDYGEIGYPTGMGAWVLCPDAAKAHVHEGFWCGDPAARASYRDAVLERHGSAAAADLAYGTEFAATGRIAAPARPDDPRLSDRFREEFVGWYQGALVQAVERLVLLARRHFPVTQLAVKLGYAGEDARYGQDYTQIGTLAERHGLHVWSTHGTLPILHHKRIMTICRVLDVPYCTEGITERTPAEVRARLFEDASDGSRSFFEFHDTFDVCVDELARHGRLLRGVFPEIDVALLFHSTQQARRPGQSLPPRLHALSEPLRDLLDYEVLDEDLLLYPGALDRHGVLVLPDLGPLRPRTVATLVAFAEQGGVLVLPRPAAVEEETGLLERLGLAPADPAGGLAFRVRPVPCLDLRFGHDDEWFVAGRLAGREAAAPFFGGPADGAARWIGGDVTLRLPVDPAHAWHLALTLFADPRIEPARWELTVNGLPFAAGLAAGVSTVEVTLSPEQLAGAHWLEVRLRGPTFRPCDHERTEDRRSLGLLLQRAVLTAAGAEGEVPARARPALLDPVADPDVLARQALRVGRGAVLVAPGDDLPALAAWTFAASAHRSRLVPGAVDAWQPDGQVDGVVMTRQADRVLVYNPGEQAVERMLHLPGGDVPLALGPGEIVER